MTSDSIIATGYYRLGRWDDEPADPKLAFYDDIDDIVRQIRFEGWKATEGGKKAKRGWWPW